ncbi:MAG: hypothetical protein C0506_01530 [Anaerolinea sp.]|nr:hypothetical protein [Anaerolinea sp.]
MPHPKRSEPSVAGWRRLYEAALKFRDQAPWLRFTDADLFSVEMPETGESAYCAVMGAAGLEYGLLAHRGPSGLLAYSLMVEAAVDRDEVLLIQDGVSFSLVDRQYLDDADRAVHALLGLRFRGRGAWPLFRRHRPNLLPSRLEIGDVEFLATCLEQTCLLAGDASAGSLPMDAGEGRVVVRRRDGNGSWETATVSLPPLHLEVAFDRARLERARRRFRLVAQHWEVRLLALVPLAGEKGEPAFWGRMLLCVDRESGFILPCNVLDPADSVQDAFLGAIEGAGIIPETLSLTSLLLEQQLRPVAAALEIKLQLVAKLPELDAAATALKTRFG